MRIAHGDLKHPSVKVFFQKFIESEELRGKAELLRKLVHDREEEFTTSQYWEEVLTFVFDNIKAPPAPPPSPGDVDGFETWPAYADVVFRYEKALLFSNREMGWLDHVETTPHQIRVSPLAKSLIDAICVLLGVST